MEKSGDYEAYRYLHGLKNSSPIQIKRRYAFETGKNSSPGMREHVKTLVAEKFCTSVATGRPQGRNRRKEDF
jgi:hypothetical protein